MLLTPEATSTKSNTLANRHYVRDALQQDFVLSVKARNGALHDKLHKADLENESLRQQLADQQTQINRSNDLVDMLINRKPQLLLSLDGLTLELLVSNGTTSVQNLSMIQTIIALKNLNEANGGQLASKVGFKLSGSYLTRENLEDQVFGDQKVGSSGALEERKRSIMERRKTRRMMASGMGSAGSGISSSRFQSDQQSGSGLKQSSEPQKSNEGKINAWDSKVVGCDLNLNKEEKTEGNSISKETLTHDSNQENKKPEEGQMEIGSTRTKYQTSEFINESSLKNAFSVSNELQIDGSYTEFKDTMSFVKSTVPVRSKISNI